MIAAFVISAWDLCFDPLLSHFSGLVIFERGGGYFGVPAVNYAGWLLCTWAIVQLFALIVPRDARPTSHTTFIDIYGPPIFWIAHALQLPLLWLTIPPVIRPDQAGRAWQVRDFLDTAVVVSTYTMTFVALTCIILLHGRSRSRT